MRYMQTDPAAQAAAEAVLADDWYGEMRDQVAALVESGQAVWVFDTVGEGQVGLVLTGTDTALLIVHTAPGFEEVEETEAWFRV